MATFSFQLLCLVTVAFGLVLASGNHLPGLRVAITSDGLEYIQKTGISILENSLATTNIPDLTGKVKLHYGIGHATFHWTVSELQIKTLSIPTSSLTSNKNGLTFKASEVTAVVKGHIHTASSHHDIVHVSASTDATITFSEVSFGVSILVLKGAEGHATVSTSQCSADVSNVKIHFHGKSDWVYKVVNKIADFKKKLSQNFQPTFCKGVTNAINHHGNRMVSSLPTTVAVDKYAQLNYALIDDPTYSPQYVSADLKGEFQLISHPEEASLSPPSLPPTGNSTAGHMMHVWFTDYTANTASLVYHKAGLLDYNITSDMLPKGLPIQLNTSSLKLVLPSLYKAYPNMEVKLSLQTVKPPKFQIDPKMASVKVIGKVDVLVLSGSGHVTASAATLGVTADMDIGLWIQARNRKEVLCGNVTSVNVVFNTISSNIGSLPIKTLNTLFKSFGDPLLMKTMSEYGAKGIQFPIMDGISLVNSDITFGKGYIKVSTDMKYYDFY